MSLFGNIGQQNNQQQNNNAGTPSLFGASLNNNNNNQAKPSLFGNSTSNAAPQTQQTSSLFGGLGGQQQQQQPQQQQQQQQPQQQQQQPQQQQQNNAQHSQSMFGNLGASLIQNNANSLGASLIGASPNNQNFSQSAIGFNRSEMMPQQQKSIPDQMELILRKWSPDSPQCTMQQYFYMACDPARATFVEMPPDSDERSWEEALRNKPFDGAIPVLIKGFQNLGSRLQTQVNAVKALQMRLHEMNNSLGAMMEKHELVLSVRAAEAKRRHVGLSQRCLALAIKAQVLSSRGFVLDGVEEELKKKLAVLEKGVFDPGFAGREEEIWARMVALRERSRWLTEESEKLGKQIAGGDGGLDEAVLKKTKKILSDYDAQLTYLKKELEQVKKEYEEWVAASRPGSS